MSESAGGGGDTPETRTHAGSGRPTIASAQSLGRYQILSVAGTGGMGRVYAAFDPLLDRRVALKVVHTKEDASHQQRASREARALARLSHPNVVAVHEVTEHEGELLIAMEFVTGRTLKAWMAEHPPSSKRRWLLDALDVLLQAGRGLAAAHEAKLVHRDFKPSNVLVGDDKRVRVVDFGLARDVFAKGGSAEAGETHRSGDTSGGQITKTGAVVGTPAYMAPEQTAGKPLDGRTDQYAFCVTAWEVLHGVRPASDAVSPVEDGAVPTSVARALRKGLSKSPGGRFDSMAGLLRRLEAERQVLGGQRKRGRWGWAFFAASPLVIYGAVSLTSRVIKERELAACRVRAEAIDDSWNAEVRADLERELSSTRLGTQAYVSGISGRLDTHAESWRVDVEASCEAAISERRWTPQERRAVEWCLDEKRSEFESLLAALSSGGEVVAQSALIAVAGLQLSGACLDPSTLPELPPPELREQALYTRVRDDLRRAHSLQGTGQLSASASLSRQVLADAQGLGWEPLIARARLVLHGAVKENDKGASPVENLKRAYVEASRSGAWLLAADVATQLADTLGSDARSDDGLYWLDLAHSAVGLAGGRRELARAEISRVRCRILRRVDRFEESLAAGEEAVEVFERVLGEGHPQTALAITAVALVHQARGHFDEAERLLTRALENEERTFGAQHPMVGVRLSHLGTLHQEKGEYPTAKRHFERALVISNAAGVEYEVGTALVQRDLGWLHLQSGEPVAAGDLLRKSLDAQTAAVGNRKATLLGTVTLLALASEQAGDVASAIGAYEEAMQIVDSEEMDAKQKTTLLVNVAKFRRRQRDLDGALEVLDKALDIATLRLGPEHPEVAYVQNTRGVTLHEFGKNAEALVIVSAALALHEKSASDRDMESAWMHENLGRIHRDLGDLEKALSEFQRGQEIRLEFIKPTDELAQRIPALIEELCTVNRYAPACERQG